METLLTTIGFFALTAVFVVGHVRRRVASEPAGTAPTCPRCRAAVPPGAVFCPRCGVPQQAFELVRAPIAGGAIEGGGRPLHALVRADLCVGCGTCVAACPEPGALALLDKRAVVDLVRCAGHGECVKACPTGAIVLSTGAAVQHVEAPELSVHFETNVPGLYVVGELGGRGLIKNAINEGRIAIEHVARSLRREAATDEPGRLDVVIVGSGPAGLSAGLEALRCGLRYAVLEQGSLADTIRKYPRRKLLFAEPLRVPLYGELWIADASKESLLQVWENMLQQTGLAVRTGERVEEVAREPGGFRVRCPGGEHHTRRVVLALGRRGTPRRLGAPGEELDHVFYDIVEMEAFAGSRVLVVGGGDSALESALGLANQPGTRVTLSHRGADFARAKERNREKLEAAVAKGRIELLLGSQVREIRRELTVLEHQGRPHLLPGDVVVIRVGGEAPYPFLERTGVRIVRKEIPLAAASGAEAAAR